ncbi:hypothetical protein ABT174_41090 [Streptomyces sparsogenes]
MTEGLTERHPASRFVAAHGAGVAGIALRAPDARPPSPPPSPGAPTR